MTDTTAVSDPRPRKRDSAATKRAILDAAREVFSRSGYDAAGMREIAGLAGVDARLIGRYFGSKELLFTRVVADAYSGHLMMTPEANDETARALLTDPTQAHRDGMLLTLRSAPSERAVEIMRESLERNFQQELADALEGQDAPARAALLIAICSGVQFMRNVLQNSELVDGDPEVLTAYLKKALNAVADAPEPGK
ncbi:TetR family transcriptional regulator [Streptomyces sp. NPDC047002]|uniref:TetR/AcrR family transcriptional regulator n=1 Tax=Streptomyces sp. NPDC047002 TaxID=3155475 RepID=UPI0034557D82